MFSVMRRRDGLLIVAGESEALQAERQGAIFMGQWPQFREEFLDPLGIGLADLNNSILDSRLAA